MLKAAVTAVFAAQCADIGYPRFPSAKIDKVGRKNKRARRQVEILSLKRNSAYAAADKILAKNGD